MDQVQLNWSASLEYSNTIVAYWGRTKVRVYDITASTAGGAYLDIIDADAAHRTYDGFAVAPFAERFHNSEAAKNYAVAWIEQAYGQCWNRSLSTGVRCVELSTRINELGSRYCIACYEQYADNLHARGVTVQA